MSQKNVSLDALILRGVIVQNDRANVAKFVSKIAESHPPMNASKEEGISMLATLDKIGRKYNGRALTIQTGGSVGLLGIFPAKGLDVVHKAAKAACGIDNSSIHAGGNQTELAAKLAMAPTPTPKSKTPRKTKETAETNATPPTAPAPVDSTPTAATPA